mmetsp:Transcript_98924/g.206196  ORF Transcript_98924/g.206196 Transcript_98924/m.206196 type:complete len:85 (-) Transcript_98924:1729-1983(-)
MQRFSKDCRIQNWQISKVRAASRGEACKEESEEEEEAAAGKGQTRHNMQAEVGESNFGNTATYPIQTTTSNSGRSFECLQGTFP